MAAFEGPEKGEGGGGRVAKFIENCFVAGYLLQPKICAIFRPILREVFGLSVKVINSLEIVLLKLAYLSGGCSQYCGALS